LAPVLRLILAFVGWVGFNPNCNENFPGQLS
jgi:hypothetical protein